MDFQDNINDLKSVSLDLLYSQVSSLITSYNELKTSGEVNDSFGRRLLLLQNTIGSMKNLIQNVEEFNGLGSDEVELTDLDNKSNSLGASVSSSTSIIDNSKKDDTSSNLVFNSFSAVNNNDAVNSNSTPVIGNNTGSGVISNTSLFNNLGEEKSTAKSIAVSTGEPLIFGGSKNSINTDKTLLSGVSDSSQNVISSPVDSNNLFVGNQAVEDNSQAVIPSPVDSSNPFVGNQVVEDNSQAVIPSPVDSSNPFVGNQAVEDNSQAVIPSPVDSNNSFIDNQVADNENQAAISNSVNYGDVNVRAIADLQKFYRISNSLVKAIIVNDGQFNRLTESLDSQAQQLDFGAASSDISMNVEDMLERANDLYRRGEKQAAEELYDQINNMTLVKKVA